MQTVLSSVSCCPNENAADASLYLDDMRGANGKRGAQGEEMGYGRASIVFPSILFLSKTLR
jgi:hypothetical protein